MIERILLVDDSPIIHSLLRKTLEKHGYQICGDARNGKEAVQMHEELKPDLTFMDITMPVMDGLEALKAIKKKDPSAKVIMLSAMGDDEVIELARTFGADIFLKKPFDEYKIISAISKVV